MRWRIALIPLGVVLAFVGLGIMLLGGYMINGEAQHNLREGVPAVAIGFTLASLGTASLVIGIRSLL